MLHKELGRTAAKRSPLCTNLEHKNQTYENEKHHHRNHRNHRSRLVEFVFGYRTMLGIQVVQFGQGETLQR